VSASLGLLPGFCVARLRTRGVAPLPRDGGQDVLGLLVDESCDQATMVRLELRVSDCRLGHHHLRERRTSKIVADPDSVTTIRVLTK
jgi:hypothetical protein